MSFVDLYSHGFRERNIGHFASIVRTACVDGIIEGEELLFLKRLAKNLQISDDEYKSIMSNPKEYPINPPVDRQRRVERLYDLARMVFLEKISDKAKLDLMTKIVNELGYPSHRVDMVVSKSFEAINDNADFQTFKKAIFSTKAN